MSELLGQCHCGGVKVSVPQRACGVVACHVKTASACTANFFAMLAAPADSGGVVRRPAAGGMTCPPRRAGRIACAVARGWPSRPGGQQTALLVSAGLFSRHLLAH